jgi:peptidoglycan biosynthesis protein MviN/MurJ (putative lipid II flippase)
MAKTLIGIGILLVIVGIIWMLFPSAFSWIGNLPGDVKHTSGNTRVYFPVVTMIVISVVATIVLNLFNR